MPFSVVVKQQQSYPSLQALSELVLETPKAIIKPKDISNYEVVEEPDFVTFLSANQGLA